MSKFTAYSLYAIEPDKYGWRTLPDGRIIKVGKDCDFGKNFYFEDIFSCGDRFYCGSNFRCGKWVEVGSDFRAGSNCQFGYCFKCGDHFLCKDNFRVICDNVTFGDYFRFQEDNITCGRPILSIICEQFICHEAEQGKIRIGCVTLPIEALIKNLHNLCIKYGACNVEDIIRGFIMAVKTMQSKFPFNGMKRK